MVSDKKLYKDALEIVNKKFGDEENIEIVERKDMDFDSGVYTIKLYNTNKPPSNFDETLEKILLERDFSNNQFQIAIDGRGGGYYIHIGEDVTRRIRD